VIITGALLALWWNRLFPHGYQGLTPANNSWHEKIVEFERDRVLSMSKGLAGTGAGFLVALITALLKGEIVSQVSYVAILGCAVGAMGAILLAWSISMSTRDFVLNPTR
jgi:hypothetical protein